MSDIDIASIVVPGGNSMSPPELPANAPVLNVVHPVEVGLRPVFRNKLDAARFDGFDSRLGQWLDFYVPLIRKIRLDDGVAAIATGNLDNVVFDFLEQTQRFEFGNNCFACVEAVHAAIFFGHVVVERGIVGQNVVYRQVMTFANVIVIEIVRWRNLYATRTKLRIDVIICNNRNTSTYDWQDNFLSDQVFVTLVVRVHGNRAIAKHGFRASCCNDKVSISGSQRVAKMPQAAAFVL